MKSWTAGPFRRIWPRSGRRYNPKDIILFHGNLDPDRLNFAEKMIIKSVKATVGDFRDWLVISRLGAVDRSGAESGLSSGLLISLQCSVLERAAKPKTEALNIEPPFFMGQELAGNYLAVTPFSLRAACAAARRAIGTRKGEQLT